MRIQSSLLQPEPETHTCGCHWREWVLCEDYRLTPEQLHSFYTLKQQANILFEGQNERWDLFKALYAQYFGQPAKVQGKEWMKLGFQGQYPQTDLRGGGVISLELILRYTKRNRQLVQQMQNDKGNFFFAITAINVCFFMKNYFHLTDSLVPHKDKHTYCDRRALKNFCMLLLSDDETFLKLHQIILTWFYKEKWVQTAKEHPETLLHFNSLFADLKIKVQFVFENFKIQNWKDFDDAWNA